MKKLIKCLAFIVLFCFHNNNLFAQQFKALLITKTQRWHHESINDGVTALKEMAKRNFFEIQWHQDATKITDHYLSSFQVIIFLNTTGSIFSDDEKKSIERFIQSGKGFAGIHSASDTEYGWEWYTKLVGRMFHIHPVIQTAKLKLIDNKFLGMQGFSEGQIWTDEWYEFEEEKSKNLHYVLAVDESTYNPIVEWTEKKLNGQGMGNFHPIAWYHEFDGGRSFYTSLGHLSAEYADQTFLNHIYGGIFWAATGKK